MTPKQKRFVAEYLNSGNATEAARGAGYKSPRVIGSRLTKVAPIANAIRAGQAENQHKLGVERDNIIAELHRAFELAKQRSEPAMMVRACAEIAKICGFYDATHTAPQSRTAAITAHWALMERMTDEELLAIIAERDAA